MFYLIGPFSNINQVSLYNSHKKTYKKKEEDL